MHIEVSGKIRIPTTPMEHSFTGVMQVRKTFVCKVIGQSTPFPDADNTITATLAMNVALLRSRTASMSISGLVGAISEVGGLIELRACACALQLEKLGLARLCPTSCTCTPTQAEAQVLFKPYNCNNNGAGRGVWNASSYSINLFLKKDSRPDEMFLLQFIVKNPAESQSASVVQISATSIAPEIMDSGLSDEAPIRVVEKNLS